MKTVTSSPAHPGAPRRALTQASFSDRNNPQRIPPMKVLSWQFRVMCQHSRLFEHPVESGGSKRSSGEAAAEGDTGGVASGLR
jgi:hypothetical protein